MKNNVRKVIVYPSGSAAMVTIHRTDREPRRMVGKRVDTVLGILSNGTWQSTISVVDNREIGEGFKIQAITYRPMELSEHGYREVLSFVFRWITNNIDGYLEDNEQADKCWHLLGSIVEKGPYWTRELHKQEFLNLLKTPKYWESFWRTKG